MPKYLGPYDVVTIDGKEYQRGDNVQVSKDRLRQLTRGERYLFEDVEQPPAVPVMGLPASPSGETRNEPEYVSPPDEHGVVSLEPEKVAKKS